VHVSIVNWVEQPDSPPEQFLLDGQEVAGITPELRPIGESAAGAERLSANAGRSFQGPIPVGGGFILTNAEAQALLARGEADYEVVVRPYLDSEDIADNPEQSPSRWIIDFGLLALEEAMGYPAALKIVRARVKPERDNNRDKGFRQYWWRFGRPRVEMRQALSGLGRYIAGVRHGKRAVFTWCEPRWLASDATVVFAFEDDYAFGILSSAAHRAWAWARSSTLKGDIRYTPTTVFETFPWPDPITDDQREQIAAAARQVVERRQGISLYVENGIGLTDLYNRLEEGAYDLLRDEHRNLDEAVAAAYGWPKSISQDSTELVRHILALNEEIASGVRKYNPFGTPASGGEEPRLL
jgi:hypothetical protein